LTLIAFGTVWAHSVSEQTLCTSLGRRAVATYLNAQRRRVTLEVFVAVRIMVFWSSVATYVRRPFDGAALKLVGKVNLIIDRVRCGICWVQYTDLKGSRSKKSDSSSPACD
jgi:hypothetical protein